ncbi:MAG: alpha/beta hydrolase [Gammaproteobacteria bacterium]|nr:alpha/beta hydrolase [Gammaproteobacteria bacterium]MDH5694124.1 alpha/beta hydrolase [Gammaproteobacteria bacterium]
MKIKALLKLLALLWFGAISTQAIAETVELQLSNKARLELTADYKKGDINKPAVLILHGFLQTRNFLTIASLAESVSSTGHAVLSPTLSLGVSNRIKSLACEAVHTHSMESDLKEIDLWVNWLQKKGYKKVILVGHSFGSLQLLHYANSYSSKNIDRLVMASLIDTEYAVGSDEYKSQLDVARKNAKTNPASLGEYKISYCKKYPTPHSAFFSYARWTGAEILKSLKSVKVPAHVILGSSDTRMGKQWPDQLKQSGIKIEMIKGANHFFDKQHEFDLSDLVETIITNES